MASRPTAIPPAWSTVSRALEEGGAGRLEACMERFVAGDTRAFEEIFLALAPRIAAGLRLMTGDAALAQDLTQATFLKVLHARDTYQRGMAVEAWVWAIARHTWIDERRRRARRPEILVHEAPDVPGAPEEPGDPRAERLMAAFHSLPLAQREALILLKVQDLSASEAAAAVGTSAGAIKMRAQRAYETLRRLLSPAGRR